MEDKELQHVGVLGMKWGHRRARAADAAERDAADLRKHGYHKEAAALSANAKKLRAKQAEIDGKKKAKDLNLEAKLKLRAKNAAELKKQFVKEAVEAGAKRGKKVDTIKEEKYWDDFFKEDLNNVSADSYRKEQRVKVAKGVALAVGIIGTIAVKNYMVNTALRKAAGM
jgi:hypothetical protein